MSKNYQTYSPSQSTNFIENILHQTHLSDATISWQNWPEKSYSWMSKDIIEARKEFNNCFMSVNVNEEIREKRLLKVNGEENRLNKDSLDRNRKHVVNKKEMELVNNNKHSLITINDNENGKKLSQIFRNKNLIKANKINNLQKTTKEYHYEKSKSKHKELTKSPYQSPANEINKQTSNKSYQLVNKFYQSPKFLNQRISKELESPITKEEIKNSSKINEKKSGHFSEGFNMKEEGNFMIILSEGSDLKTSEISLENEFSNSIGLSNMKQRSESINRIKGNEQYEQKEKQKKENLSLREQKHEYFDQSFSRLTKTCLNFTKSKLNTEPQLLSDGKERLNFEENGNKEQNMVEENVRFIYHAVVQSNNVNDKGNLLKVKKEAEIKMLTTPLQLESSSEDNPELFKLTSNSEETEYEVERELKKFEIVFSPSIKKEVPSSEEHQKQVPIPEEIMYTFSCDKSFTKEPKSTIMIEKKHFDNLALEEDSNLSSIFSKSQIKEMGIDLDYSHDQVVEEFIHQITNKIPPKKIFKIQEQPQQTEQIKQMILMEKLEKEKFEKLQMRKEQKEAERLNENKKRESEEKEMQHESEKVLFEKNNKKDERQEKPELNAHSVRSGLIVNKIFPQKEDSRRSFFQVYTNSNIVNFSGNRNECCINQNEISSEFSMPKIGNQERMDKKSECSKDSSTQSLKVYEPWLKSNCELLD